MKRSLLSFSLLLAAITQIAAGDESAAIVAATKSYVAANSGMTKITATVEQMADDFARVRVAPEDAKNADPAWVFLQKRMENGLASYSAPLSRRRTTSNSESQTRSAFPRW
jgi:hypothetical protein